MADIIPYTEIYIDKCFYEWYKAGRPKLKSVHGSHVMKVIPPDERGRKPNIMTVRGWMEKYGWEQRADALDAQLSLKFDTEAIEAKAKLYNEISEIGKDTMLRGYDYLKKNGFDTSAAALRAVFGGADLVAKFGSAAEMLLAVGGMTDAQVMKEIARLTSRNDDTIINAETEDINSMDSTDEDTDNNLEEDETDDA